MRKLLAVVLVLALSGCSFLITRGPRADRAAGEEPECTSSMGATRIDMVIGLVGAVAAIFGAVGRAADGDEDTSNTLLVGGLVTLVLSQVSSGVSYFRIKRCRRAIDEWQTGAAQPNQYQPARPSE